MDGKEMQLSLDSLAKLGTEQRMEPYILCFLPIPQKIATE